MTKKSALIISVFYHPLLMTSLFIASLMFLTPELLGQVTTKGKLWLTGLFFFLTFVLPMVNIYILKKTSNISSLYLNERRERLLPMGLSSIYYGITTYFVVYKIPVGSNLINILVLSVFITITVITIITFFWKISAHSAGAWGGVGFFSALSMITMNEILQLPLIICILLAGLTSSARLYLNVHNQEQIFAGGLLGFLICFCSVYLLY